MASPLVASGNVKSDPLNLEPKEFGAKLDQLAKHFNNLMSLAKHVYELGKSEKLPTTGGLQIGRKELRSLNTQFVSELKSLKKNYTAHGKRQKRVRDPSTTAGFKNPIVVTQNMREFLANANLGPSDPRNPMSAPLNKVLTAGTQGLTTRAILTPLFNIYAVVNGIQRDPNQRQFLTSTPEMDRYFAQTFANLVAADKAEPRFSKKPNKQGVRTRLPDFDPKHFTFARIQSIVADNTVSKDVLPAEYLAALESPELTATLAREQQTVSSALKYYKEQKNAAKKSTKRSRKL